MFSDFQEDQNKAPAQTARWKLLLYPYCPALARGLAVKCCSQICTQDDSHRISHGNTPAPTKAST
jgi:hypothetical protein